MQTFNIFPELFNFSLISPIILRVVLGIIFLNLGILKLTTEKKGWLFSLNLLGLKPAGFFLYLLSLVEIAGGIFLIAGAYTQLVALVLAVISIGELFVEYREESVLKRDLVFYLLLATICLSLLLTGAGLFAVDIPVL
jgi:uncharacterized membrane protein YphA (DoxX/SURF4 family)